MTAPTVLSIRGLHKRFGDVRALDGVDLDVGQAEFVVVLGATGAGKTTLLRVIAGLERCDAGSLSIAGREALELAPPERDVALVFQNFALYPNMLVRENLAFPLLAPGRALAPNSVVERVEWAARLLHIERLLDRPSRQLSGGEMQRVAIGRAIVRRPRLFLMDEPLSNLDAKLREELRIELRELARRLATPVLWVTHDQVEALSMADRIIALERGRVLQAGPPEEIYARPASPAVAKLLGNPPINIVRAQRENGWWVAIDRTPLLRASDGGENDVHIGFRPEHVALSGGTHEGVVEVVEDVGPARVLLVRWAGAEIHVLVERSLSCAVGERVRPSIDAERAVVWPLVARDTRG